MLVTVRACGFSWAGGLQLGAMLPVQGMSGGVWRRLWLPQLEEVRSASGGEKPGMLLHFLKGIGQPPNTRLTWSQLSLVPGLLCAQLVHAESV